jgi:hypothetical protein
VQTGRQPVLALQLDQAELPELPAGLGIREVSDPETLRDWVHAFAPAFGVRDEHPHDRAMLESGRLGDITRFAGFLDGRIVGTASLFAEYGVAGIYTLPRRGSTADAALARR